MGLDVSRQSYVLSEFIRLRFMFSAHLFFSLFPEEIRQIYIMVNKLSLSEGRQEGKKTDLVSVGGRDVEN